MHPSSDMHLLRGLIPISEARGLLGDISPMTEYRWRQIGALPKALRIGKRAFYHEGELRAAIEKIRSEGVL